MISKSILNAVLAKALSTGADFAEVFAERTLSKNISMIDSKVSEITDSLLSGVGIRILMGTRSVYASTTDLSYSGLINCAAQVASALSGVPNGKSIHLTERIFGDIHPIRIVPSSVSNAQKIDLLKEGYFSAKNYHKEIAQVMGNILDVDHNIMIANSDGLYTEDRQVRTRMVISAIASKDGENQTGSFAPGRRMGLEMFDMISPKSIGEKAAKQAITMLHADYCPAGNYPVAIENGFGGVIFHEACGHSLESSSVALGQSVFSNKLGKQIANPKVTAIDDGTISNAWGSINVDDEGNSSRRNVLIENGILKSYMIDKLGGRRMGMEATGNCRRQSYAWEPTSRMTNTMILAGQDKNEDIISSMEYGLYAADMGGGSVNPITGEFNFSVREGYMVRDGKICEPVRGASLIGKGSEILMNIDMVGTNLATGQGMCGSSSGSIPTDVGQPLLRVSSITVGGR
ncbi:TldD/PmbA family protein [Lachnoclostridium phytofermentans]|uniref:Peptidase U62 modulator of DNA gyrase n=1 Tax=Lachnoclostridium phytofermentans (strain ATCC 700394 / DSM 18823 / ISDg) TaxID=357809 RepID=A9KQF1_LACP7|nr:TldD/PmbA family protein [Lachnoclostridium phytofermentans]ABX40460.1 peptidase U62 modulator of DNA gyrase [Lachnoclostridium phytofermentans ISDg]